MNVSLFLFAPENLVSRDGLSRPVPRQPAHSPHSGRIWRLLAGFLPISAAASIYLYRHAPSGQSRVDWVTQLRTDGVHCRESTCTGPEVFKVVPVTGAAFAGHHRPINVRLLFPITTIGMKWTSRKYRNTYAVVKAQASPVILVFLG